MTVWKNDVKLGVLQAERLSGPLCWAVSMYYSGSSARIESAVAPASPMEEELPQRHGRREPAERGWACQKRRPTPSARWRRKRMAINGNGDLISMLAGKPLHGQCVCGGWVGGGGGALPRKLWQDWIVFTANPAPTTQPHPHRTHAAA